jgi:hypothetical protein
MGVFISYSNQDEGAVRALAADLGRARQTVWLDRELHGGDTWWQTILKQIQDADVFVFALSNNSQRSKPCRAELEYARALGIPVLPVQIGPLDGLRSTAIADLQIVDYRRRDTDTALELIAAVQEAKLRRGPLPEPLPDQPPIPFEYLMRLGRAIDAPQMNPSEQVGVIAQLRQGLEDEDDANARRDIAVLLRNMRRRPDATYRSVSEIDALLATIDQAPPTEAEAGQHTHVSGNRGLLAAWAPGPLTRRQVVLAASSILIIIALAIVLMFINSPTGNSPTGKVTTSVAYVYQSPSLDTRVGELKDGTEVTIQCVVQGQTVGVSSSWYRIEEGYTPGYSLHTQGTPPNC